MISLSELATGFSLGNQAILTNVCLLPLYPGLIAFLAGNATNERSKAATRWLGVVVLAGILTMMILVGLFLHVVNRAFGDVLIFLLPVIYGFVVLLGLLMLTGRNPFSRMTLAQTPMMNNPYATAYIYGLLLGPMTLPCTGPIITTAFILGAGGAGQLSGELLYVVAFGIGFGWPLVILPFFAMTAQRRFTKWLSQNHVLLTRASGLMLVAIGVFGAYTELLPNIA